MLIERIIFLYNPFNPTKELKKQREIDEAQKEENFEPVIDVKKLISIEEIKNEEEELKKNEDKNKEIMKSMFLTQEKGSKKSITKTIVKENIFKYPIFYKFIFQIILLIAVGYFVFIFMPTNGTNRYTLKHKADGSFYYTQANGFLMGFYFLYCLYFLASSFQIKYIYLLNHLLN